MSTNISSSISRTNSTGAVAQQTDSGSGHNFDSFCAKMMRYPDNGFDDAEFGPLKDYASRLSPAEVETVTPSVIDGLKGQLSVRAAAQLKELLALPNVTSPLLFTLDSSNMSTPHPLEALSFQALFRDLPALATTGKLHAAIVDKIGDSVDHLRAVDLQAARVSFHLQIVALLNASYISQDTKELLYKVCDKIWGTPASEPTSEQPTSPLRSKTIVPDGVQFGEDEALINVRRETSVPRVAKVPEEKLLNPMCLPVIVPENSKLQFGGDASLEGWFKPAPPNSPSNAGSTPVAAQPESDPAPEKKSQD